ncbi:uncharacterized protein LOC122033503 isoform X1 [Zingiber officinale]|uniref:uncharacterized protein LOC122033503 isoform X1 n=1 Tax=Zingiber officinale TaxID=94328 RepID=UPI001C4C90FA|nr:uncharacterized protein LOC122033503 isoform X1 [Zingiber officinale]XP_042448477.1 uncharacterized protein LOC122033503 isoform X1 [Zingiber officinale]
MAQFSDSSKMAKSHKLAHKKHGDGFEAPRNSLDISSTSRGYHYITEDIPVKCHSSKVNYCTNIGTSMKKLIDGEIFRQTSDSRVQPSVAPRLMGTDSIPERGLKAHTKEHGDHSSRRSIEISKAIVISSGMGNSCSSTSSRESKQSLLLNSNERHSIVECRRKLQQQKHPQEEQLQKFKEEFEAWQASKLWQHSRSQKNRIVGDGKDYQTLGQEILNQKQMDKYLETKKKMTKEKTAHLIDNVTSSDKQIIDAQEEASLHSHAQLNKHCLSFSNSSLPTKLNSKENDLDCFPVTKTERKKERTSSATRIVILKPNFDRIDGNEEQLAASSDPLVKEHSMEDFLEEVKERLKNEVIGRSRNNFVSKGNEVRTSFDERAMNPKQIAHDIAKQIKESVTRDMGTKLIRSNSTRSSRSDIQINAPNSPGFIRRNTRKLLSEKSKNVLKNELFLENPSINHGDSGASANKGKAMPEFIFESNKGKKVYYWKSNEGVNESDPSLTQKFLTVDSDLEPQWNLIRSLSAPVSGTTFGRLLLEDRHIAAAQICRKLEASDNKFSELRKQRKDSFNLKGTVSALKHNLNFKGMLFWRKDQQIKEPSQCEFIPVEIKAAPTIVTNFGIIQENSTEVPPSPASVSSSSEEFCKQDNPSPISPLEVMEYHTSSCISEELSSNAPGKGPDMSENLEQVGMGMAVRENHQKQEVGMENKDASYSCDILANVGFCEDKSTDQANSKSNELSRPILHQVFGEVEEVCSKYGKVDTDSYIPHNDDVTIGHKLLFDLVNESLQIFLGPKIKCSMFNRWILGPASSSQGKRSLEDLWDQIQLYLNPSIDRSNALDSMVAQDLKMATWPTMLYEDMDVIGRQIERVILLNLINDVVKDMYFGTTR